MEYVTTRWKLKKAIRRINQVLVQLQLKKHPDKTEMGRTSKTFTFLGYTYAAGILSVAQSALENCLAKCEKLYEHGEELSSLARYWRRWQSWAKGGLKEIYDAGSLYLPQLHTVKALSSACMGNTIVSSPAALLLQTPSHLVVV